MSNQPASSTSYRNSKVEDDDDEDDLDDLDDVLASFNKPKPTAGKRPHPQDSPKPAPPPIPSSSRQPSNADASSSPPEAYNEEDDFEASLVEGMESLLRQLAGDHPPGPMPDKDTTPSASTNKPANKDLSPEEEEAAWQRAVETLLSGEGLAALGLDQNGKPASSNTLKVDAKSKSEEPEKKPDFEETIRKTMEQLKQPKKGSSGGMGGAAGEGDIAALLAQLGSDPSALDGLGGDGDDDLGGLLDGMMAQLMTKEVLEEPMSELASKYPEYLANPPAGTSPADLEKYKSQHRLVKSIVEMFQKPGYTDEKDGKEIARLVGEMQDLGGPPSEIMGDLPEGFDLGALGGGNEDGCTIM